VSEGTTGGGRPTEASFHPVEGGGVLFDAAQGRLYALNRTAGLTWLCIRDGLSEQESTLALAKAFAVDRTIAAEWFRMSMDTFHGLGLLETDGSTKGAPAPRIGQAWPKPSTRGGRPGSGRAYRLLDHLFSISAPPGPLAAVESLLATLRVDPARLEEDGFPAVDIDIVAQGDRWNITVAGRVEATCESASIVAEIEQLLVQTVVPATPHLLTLHAAALERGGRTLLLAGPSGAGKTTLSLALARAGWNFGSDEILLLDRDLGLRALPLPPCIKADAFPLIESWFPELRSAPQHERYGYVVKYLPIRSMPLVGLPGYVVFLRFDPEGPNDIQPLDPFGALERLLAQCVFIPAGFQQDDVERLLRWHGGNRYFDLSFRECDAAVASLACIDLAG
jgi:hypothetical protein